MNSCLLSVIKGYFELSVGYYILKPVIFIRTQVVDFFKLRYVSCTTLLLFSLLLPLLHVVFSLVRIYFDGLLCMRAIVLFHFSSSIAPPFSFSNLSFCIISLIYFCILFSFYDLSSRIAVPLVG